MLLTTCHYSVTVLKMEADPVPKLQAENEESQDA